MKQPIHTLLALAAACSVSTGHAQDATAGRNKAAMCLGCHGISGYQASFPEVYKVPKISGQNGKYIISALTAYRKGDRKHPTMRGIAGSLTDRDMADLAAFYEKDGAELIKPVADTPAAAPSPEVAALLAKGACNSCHGPNFSKPIDGAYPKIAGQYGDYLFAALRAYSTEGKSQFGRVNAIMAGQARQFKREELQALAKYISSLPGELRTVPESKFR